MRTDRMINAIKLCLAGSHLQKGGKWQGVVVSNRWLDLNTVPVLHTQKRKKGFTTLQNLRGVKDFD